MSKFKEGDKIELVKDVDAFGKIGMIGEIVGIPNDEYSRYAVRFKRGFDGHSCGGLIANNEGYFVWHDDMKLIKNELKNTKMDIEAVKKLDKDVIKAAKEKVLEDRKETQTKQAVEVLTELFNKKDAIEEKIGEEQEELNQIGEQIKVFDVKKK